MFNLILTKIIGSQNERELKRIQPLVDRINVPESEISRLSDHELKSKTVEFKSRLEQVKRSPMFSRKLLPAFARPPGAPSVCATMTCS